jgi:type VI secretion system VgrG family protein
MNLSSDVVFSFQCDGIEENSFKVLSFTGSEKLGELYQFDIQLVSYSDAVDPDQLLDSSCHLSIQSYDKTRQFNGILSNFSYLNPTENGHLFQATLVPKLWLLSQFTTNEVYLGLNLSDTLALLFDEAGLTSDEYDLSQISHYREWDYRCQFGESHYSFLKRITEREGVYFYFSQENNTAKAIFCNKNNQHPTQTTTTTYTPITGSSYSEGSPVIFQWTQNNQRVPKEVIVKDYNNDRPSVDLSARSKVDPSGLGEVFRYCDNLYDSDEASILADIRAEELFMQKTQFFGSSLDIEISPGYPLILTAHPLQKLNNEYCPISISHSGYASDLMQTQKSSEQPYSNTIQAISVDVQFRPEQKTEKPRFYGVLNALVDSEGDGKYAHIDKRGRYRVTLPFDRKDRDGAQASWWIPMSQPNAGENSGMHFPLLKGAEVLLSFIGGDPDRPVITGAVPNASKPSVVSEDNHTQNKIKTAGNNIIEIEDEAGSERIKLYSPNSSSYFHLGAANPVNANGIMMMSSGGYYQEIGGGYQITRVTANNFSACKKSGATEEVMELLDGDDVAADLIDETKLHVFKKGDDNGELKGDISATEERSGKYFIHRENGEKYFWNDGNTYTFGGAKDFGYGNGYEVNYVDPDSVSDWDGSFPIDESFDDEALDKILISKTIGDTYDYQRGVAKERLYGDSYSVHVGKTAMEGNALIANIGAGVFGFNIDAELSGVKFDLDLSAIKIDIELGIGKFSLSKAIWNKEFFEGGFEQGVKEDASISSAGTFKARSAPIAPPTPSTLNAIKSSTELVDLEFKDEPSANLTLDHAASKALLDLKPNATDTQKFELTADNATISHTKDIQVTAKEGLTLKGKTILADGVDKVDIKTKSTTIEASTDAKIDSPKVEIGQTNTVKVESAGITLTTGSNSIKVATTGVTMTSSGVATINGSVIKLG